MFLLAAAGAFALALSAAAREVPIVLLHTADLHGHLTTSVPAPGETNSAAGLLRIATLVREVRRTAENVLLFDCGDTYQGAPESYVSKGRVMVDAMALLRYDAGLVGNHEFDWGVPRLAALVGACPHPVLAANVVAREGVTNPLARVQPFLVRDLDGVRIAIAGLTSPGMAKWFLPQWLGALEFPRSAPTLERILPAIRSAKPDVLVLLVHQGLPHGPADPVNEAADIARRFPEFDVILGGHTHEEVAGQLLEGTLYSQAGPHGGSLGRVDLVYDTVARRVTSKRGTLLPVTADVPEDAELARAAAPVLKKAAALLETSVGRTAAALSPPEAERLLREAIAAASGAQLVLHGALADVGLPAGVVRERDLWRVVPYENRIGTAWLNFPELREILEEDAAWHGTPHFLNARGLAFDLAAGAPAGQRIRRLRLADGTVPHPRKRFQVAFNSFTLASGGGRFPRLRAIVLQPESRFELTETDTRDALRQYLRAHRPLELPAAGDEGARIVTVKNPGGATARGK